MWRVCAVLVACGTWAAPMAAADRSWDEEPFRASAAELARAAAALSRDEPAAVRVLLSETELTYDEAGRRTSRERIVYVIETDAGREGWDTLTVTWAPWHQARPELRARVVTRDGREHLLDPATIAESAIGEADDKVFSDRRRLAAPLPAVTVGAIVEHQSVVRDESAWFPAGTVTRLYLGANAPVTRARLAIESPSSMALRFSTELLPGLEPRSSEIAGRTRHVFEADHLDPFLPAEPNLPPDAPRWPNVTVSTAASWSAVARAYADVVERQLQGVNVSAQAREAGGKNRGRREVVQQLLKRLDEIRYTGVQFGQASFVPRRPDEVLARRYGDCKDKATLLVAWLRAAGIPASLALLAAGYDQDVPETLPGMGLFNHAIVYVPGSPALWIDPTVERARAGELPLNDQGRLALVADPDTTGLVRIPESTASENSVVQAREFRLSEMGTASVAESAEYRGVFDRHHRGRWSTEAEADLRKAQESYVREEYLAESVSTLDHGPVEDLDRPFRVTTQAKDAQRGYTDEKGAVVVYFPGRLTADLPAALLPPDAGAAPPEEETREGAFFFPIPHVVEHRYRIVPPPGFGLSELPQPEDVPLGGGRYSSHWTTTPDGVVTGTVRFESGPRTIDATRFEEMRRGVKELRARPGVAVRFLQSGEAHLGDGRIREALTEFEKLAALHPKEALHRTQVALALLSGGLGDEARREARLAVEMEPASLLALSLIHI